ncbi:MAG TPA: hypothetical protein VG673_08610, partial [Actinomycetota bacterium]|nr:hypothetical protein [Actinomycetota bacterium]
MPEVTQQVGDGERAAGPVRRLVRSFSSTDSYGLVLLMIVTTYVLAAALSQRWAATVLLITQIASVWLALRTSQARRGVRLAANGLFVLAAAAAVANLLPRSGLPLEPSMFVASGVLYLVA